MVPVSSGEDPYGVGSKRGNFAGRENQNKNRTAYADRWAVVRGLALHHRVPAPDFLERCARDYLVAVLSRRTLRRGRALDLALTCLWIGVRTHVLDARQWFVLALVGIPPPERLIRDAVGPHFVFSKHPVFGAGRLAAEAVHCTNRLEEFNARRRRNEVYSLASIAHDTHMDRHRSTLNLRLATGCPRLA